MSCELAQVTVHGYFDGELDAVRAAEFERHLETCAECQLSLSQLEALRSRLRQSALYEHASEHLQKRLQKQLGINSGKPSNWRGNFRFWVPVLAGLVAATLFFLLASSRARSGQLTAELIDAHVRALQPGHLSDVQSTDQHTVKPWFDGKLDFVPPVTDYAQQGFPLIGGRLDVVDGHNVAALVYGRRKHLINLFVWPARRSATITENSGSRQGFNWTTWHAGDMDYALISDVSAADLRELKDLIHTSQHEP